MNIVIIGSGNVAAVLGRKFLSLGHCIIQIYSRNASAATALAYEWDTESTNYISTINKTADFYLIAVADNAIETIAKELQLPDKIVVHTAASVSKNVLKAVTKNYGVFYPLQSLRKEMILLPHIPVFVDAANESTQQQLLNLANSFANTMAAVANDDERIKLHLSAVFVSNFVNHLYSLAFQFCKNEGLDFSQLFPLIIETAQRIETSSPSTVQTGPAIRHDSNTIEKHLALLEKYPPLKNIYTALTNSIQTSS